MPPAERSELAQVVNAPDYVTKFWLGLVGMAFVGAVAVSTNYNAVRVISENTEELQSDQKELQAIVSDLAAYTRESVIQGQSYQSFTDRRVDQAEMDIDVIQQRINTLAGTRP